MEEQEQVQSLQRQVSELKEQVLELMQMITEIACNKEVTVPLHDPSLPLIMTG